MLALNELEENVPSKCVVARWHCMTNVLVAADV